MDNNFNQNNHNNQNKNQNANVSQAKKLIVGQHIKNHLC